MGLALRKWNTRSYSAGTIDIEWIFGLTFGSPMVAFVQADEVQYEIQ